MERLRRSWAKKRRLCLGLMSGSSADGVDAALVAVRDPPGPGHVEVLAFRTLPYPPGMRSRLIRAAEEGESLREALELDILLGEIFADAALRLLARVGCEPAQVDVLGAHGHTLLHQPPGGRSVPCSFQAASGEIIAERTGIPTITHFRARDLAAGGQGAPLVPYVDYLLFRPAQGAVALLNIGGIANLTLVTPDPEGVVAFDTGPGNAMIDHAARLATRDEQSYDRDGRLAAAGEVDEALLTRLLAHGYFSRPIPKSVHRDTFGARYTEKLARGRIAPVDLVTTLTHFTAESICRAFAEHVFPRARPREVLVSGGGAHNPVLMKLLREKLHPVPIHPLRREGLTPDNKEAVAFAVLAHETLCGRPGNLPAATGAAWPAVLGRLHQ